MSNCAYCERPLMCDGCDTPFVPADADQYRALSTAEAPVWCGTCERLLVCHWCHTPYDGGGDDPGDDSIPD